MKRIAGFIGLAFLYLIVACSSMAPQWQPTAVTDFKSVAGKWEGFLTSDDPRTLHFDRVTLVIDDTGGCEASHNENHNKDASELLYVRCVRRKSTVSFDRRQTERDIREGRPHDSAALCGSSKLVSVCSKLRVKIVKGSPIPPISNAPETLPPQNDDPLPKSFIR